VIVCFCELLKGIPLSARDDVFRVCHSIQAKAVEQLEQTKRYIKRKQYTTFLPRHIGILSFVSRSRNIPFFISPK